MTKVILTGASGMLGRHVLESLEGTGIQAICLSRSRPVNLPTDAVWHSFDFIDQRNFIDLGQLGDDASEIWHVGAMLPSEGVTDQMMFDANVRPVQWLAEYALRRELRFRFVSGATVYADPHAERICEEADLSPTGFGGFYGSTKFFAEKILEYYSKQGLRVTVLRPSSVYGWGMSPNKLVARYLNLAMNDREIPLKPPFDQFFNLVFAGDVANLFVHISQTDAAGIFNLAGFNYTIYQIAQTCVDVACGGKLSPEGIKTTGTCVSPTLLFDLDDAKVRSEIGYQQRTDLHSGLSSMAAVIEGRG